MLHFIYFFSTSISTEYFKHAAHSPFFSLQNAVYFIMLSFLVPVLFTFYIQDVLKFKCKTRVPNLKKICPASSHETCQWLKFPPNGLRAQSRVSPVVGLLPSACGPACLGMAFPPFLINP